MNTTTNNPGVVFYDNEVPPYHFFLLDLELDGQTTNMHHLSQVPFMFQTRFTEFDILYSDK